MSERINKTSICSVVFLDIIDYSKMSVSDQIESKEHFNALIGEALKDVAQNDRIIIDTGDGAAISLLGAPEEALFVSMTIRDGILKINKRLDQKIFVRIGINLGPVRVVSDINGQPNVIGDGINVAQRVMSFAGPNQILVSRSYYEVTSRLTKEITNMFTYSGVKHDKHVREHEVYVVRATTDEVPVKTENPEHSEEALAAGVFPSNNKKFWVISAGVAAAIGAVAIFLLTRIDGTASDSSVPPMPQATIIPSSPVTASPSVSKEPSVSAATAVAAEPKKKSSRHKKTKSDDKAQKNPSPDNTGSVASHTDSDRSNRSLKESSGTRNQVQPEEKPAEKSVWDSIKQGGKKECTQGEIALHQCQ